MTNPIGGYFELECGNVPLYYKDGIYLNSCRNALRYIIRTLRIKKIWIPVFTCNVIEDSIKKENCNILKYNIDTQLYPVQDIPVSDFIIYNNYFGLTSERVKELVQTFPNLIVDNAQAFFSDIKGRSAIYSCRKFFGVPDGGIIRGLEVDKKELHPGKSLDLMSHLLKRIELGAESGYSDFIENESLIDKYPLEGMSNLTKTLMGNIDYNRVKKKRLENFKYLQTYIESDFPFCYKDEDEIIPMVYPFTNKDGDKIRNYLKTNQIYCANYWNTIVKDQRASAYEKKFVENTVCLPIDQRYGIKEMEYIVNLIK